MSNQQTESYLGADWIKSALKVEKMSPLGEKVADLLGDAFYGIYHLDEKQLKKVEWGNDHHITILLDHRALATVDPDTLTVLDVLGHDRMIRVDVGARANGYIQLLFHQRHSRVGNVSQRYARMEDHIAIIRSRYPSRVYGDDTTPQPLTGYENVLVKSELLIQTKRLLDFLTGHENDLLLGLEGWDTDGRMRLSEQYDDIIQRLDLELSRVQLPGEYPTAAAEEVV